MTDKTTSRGDGHVLTCTTSGHLPHSCPHALFAMNAIQESRQYTIHVYIITLASSDVVFFHSENYKICT